jgi:hypothetical protein
MQSKLTKHNPTQKEHIFVLQKTTEGADKRTQLDAVVRLRILPTMSPSVYLEMHSFIVSHTGSERLAVTG